MSPIANQNIGKLHNYPDSNLNTEFDRIYDFMAFVKFPQNSVKGSKLSNGSVPESKLILPLSITAVIHPDPTPEQPGYFVGDTLTVTTTSYTVLDKDLTILADDDAAGGAITITLPTAADSLDRELSIKKIGTTAEIILTGDTIDREVSILIIFQYDAVRLVSDGVEWWII